MPITAKIAIERGRTRRNIRKRVLRRVRKLQTTLGTKQVKLRSVLTGSESSEFTAIREGLGLVSSRRGKAKKFALSLPSETDLLLFSTLFATVHARPEELLKETFTESAPPMQIEVYLGRKKNHISNEARPGPAVVPLAQKNVVAVISPRSHASRFLSPRRLGGTRQLDSPVIHYFAVDEPVDRDAHHGKSLALVRKARQRFVANISSADSRSYDDLVVDREKVIDCALSIREQRAPSDCQCLCALQPARPVGKVGRVEDKVRRADLIDDREIAFA